MNKIVALIPLRGGSKSIPEKNIRPMAGKPLCAWVLEAACQSEVFSKVVVSTDSQKIREVVCGLGLPVEILDRPAALATDEASTESVMLHALQVLDFDVLVTIQATSPLLTAEHLRRALKLFEDGGYDSMLTAVRSKRFFWNLQGEPLNYNPRNRPRRQDFSGYLMENGAFYVTRRELLVGLECRLGGRVGIYEMPMEAADEIDEPADWLRIEDAVRKHKTGGVGIKLKKIKWLIVDVDGTLTDGGMYWSADGDQLKKFNTRDAKGLELVRNTGVGVALMTSEASPIVTARAKKLGIEHCFIGVKDKRACLLEFVEREGVSLQEVAYIGDDVNDFECVKIAGLSFCPSDANGSLKDVADYISALPGGGGAVREICDMVCASKVNEDDASNR